MENDLKTGDLVYFTEGSSCEVFIITKIHHKLYLCGVEYIYTKGFQYNTNIKHLTKLPILTTKIIKLLTK